MQVAHFLKMMREIVIAINFAQLLVVAKMSCQNTNATKMCMQLRTKYDNATGREGLYKVVIQL